MALRNIRVDEDPILRKKARNIDEITDRIHTLQMDMLETMYHSEGVGLAANQVGILRRIIVIDVGEGPITMINPVLIDEEGCQKGLEGCLSLPEVTGKVTRPEKVKVEYMDMEGETQVLEGEGLLAIAVCHEIDHLNGILFTDRVEEDDEEEEDDEDFEETAIFEEVEE
ncbi:peptide deformylase [Alkalibacter rhizosphaerae]|uniref:Peptide deformylase n=1 Tax=Alkalibacter rhizosphaerae TaxID=2815577 RepID=A0A974XI20_9FIRM|nr:peptide deformylase [Alkalibacter rhizosphaerae]QSX08748.1 peptide deformylase [Alkalibacter rhizosphaerae]